MNHPGYYGLSLSCPAHPPGGLFCSKIAHCQPLAAEDNSSTDNKPQKSPHLHIRSVEGHLFSEAIAITGNAKTLLKLKAQIDRALRSEESYPFSEATYRDVNVIPFEVAVKWARSKKEEMWEPGPKPEKTAEELPWAEIARQTDEEKKDGGE